MTSPLRRRGVAAASVAVATMLVLAGPVTQGSLAYADPPRPAQPGGPRSVTLITGDIVTVTSLGGGKNAVDVTRPHGAPGSYRTQEINKHLYVLPDEALPYVAAGTMDRRLFDITGLLEAGYDDAQVDGVPLIVAGAAKTIQNTTTVRQLPSLGGRAVKAKKKGVRDFWRSVTATATRDVAATPKLAPGVTKIWLDGRVQASMAESNAQIGTPTAWSAGFDGHGVKVAVLDTGVDQNHPDLAGRVSQAVSFVPGQDAGDRNGHGTHTASTIGGSGAASGGDEKGVAPGVDLIIGKVLSDEGEGAESWIIGGMEWAGAQGAKVISMSLGSREPSDGTDPMAAAVNEITADTGALFVIAAGNTGSEAGIGSPGAADSALTVGAVDKDDAKTWFSSMGPRYKDYSLKPDIAAPGNEILAAKAGGTAETGFYESMSGTSMATPHVAGAAAILAQEHPDWNWQRIKDALMSTSKQLDGYTSYEVGAGRLDVANAIADQVTATGSAYFGFFGWPHVGDSVASRTITYSNSGDSAVTLHLAGSMAEAGGPYDAPAGGGGPGPRAAKMAMTLSGGMFGLSTETITVPAHGTTTVTATADPAQGAPGTRYLGQITATDDGGVKARTQVGLYIEDERYTVHVKVLDRSGNPLGGYLELQKFGESTPWLAPVDPATGTAELRLRGGVYSTLLVSDLEGDGGPGSIALGVLGNPEVVVDHEQTLVLDARKAVAVKAVVPERTETHYERVDWYRSDGADSSIVEQLQLTAGHDGAFVLPTQKVTQGAFEVMTRWRLAAPSLIMNADGRDIPATTQAGSAYYRGTAKLDTVYVGNGAPEQYAGKKVAGKIAIATRSDAVDPITRTQAAAAAGAALLIVVNDAPGKLLEWVAADDQKYSVVPVASVSQADGGVLIARAGKVKISLAGQPNSPFVYDLVDAHPGQVPGNLTYAPSRSQLARVDSVFHGDRPAPGGEFRWDFRPYRQSLWAGLQRMELPGTRTDWVSTQPSTEWAVSTTIESTELWGESLIREAEGVHALTAGSRQTSEWFGPVTRPANGSAIWGSSGNPGYLAFNFQPWTSSGGSDRAGYMAYDGSTVKMTVARNGEQVADVSGYANAYADAPEGTSRYTVDLTATRDPNLWHLSTATHTVWEFNWTTGDEWDQPLPMLQFGFDVASNLAGNAQPGPQLVGVSAGYMPGVTTHGTVVSTKLEVSFDDGKTWKSVPVINGKAAFTAPASGKFVSLRATATDNQGGSVTQEIIRAYGL